MASVTMRAIDASMWRTMRDVRLGHSIVQLWVTETNDPARRLYERCGFALTGERKPLPSHPEYAEIAMARPA
jgi:ribosomal protein S18 acetylase RimI-like enzyme